MIASKSSSGGESKTYENGGERASQIKRQHKLELDRHRTMTMTGVKDVPAFTDKTMTIRLDGETLLVTGQNLSVKNLDVENGKLSVSGTVNSLKYSAQSAPTPLLKRIFK